MTATAARQPFLAFDSFNLAEREEPLPGPRLPALPARSPFLAVYETAGEPEADEAAREAFAALVDNLHDDEFEDSLAALHNHARAFHDQQLAGGASREQADRLLTRHFEPLMREAGAMVDAIGNRFVAQEAAGIVEHELDQFVADYRPPESFEPAFEQFSFKIFRKIGKVVKAAAGKAWTGIKAASLAWVLPLIKKHIQGFLTSVLLRVMGKLPPPLQPLARRLAAKLGFRIAEPAPPPSAPDAAATPDAAADTAGAPALPDAAAGETSVTQQELDEALAASLLGEDEADFELELAEVGAAGTRPAPPVFAELEDARERFIQQFEALKEGESPGPAIEQFFPPITAALRIGTTVFGREPFVGTIARILTPLVARFVDPAQANALSRAIADLGLKAMGAEAPESEDEDEAQPRSLAAPALAATVEETVARIAALPPEMHEDPELLEAFALEAFEASAAANLPALFSEATYRRRPDLLEGGLNAAWPLMPHRRRGPRRYKRCTQRFHVTITPHMAGEIESFEGAPLADYLHDELGMGEGEDLEAEVQLYEALPGSTLADIARGERETLGESESDEVNASALHPLTPQAAAILIGKPGLGRAWRAASRHRPLAGGQRFYALKFGGRRRPGRRRPLHLRLTLDALRDQVRVCVFVSEAKAQQLAVQLRQKADPGALAARFHRWLTRRLWHLLFGHARHRLRIVHAALPPGTSAAMRAHHLPPAATRLFANRLRAWLVKSFRAALKAQAPAILAAIENPKEGITLNFTVQQPPGLKALCDAVAKNGPAGPAIAEAIAKGAPPTVQFAVASGHACA